MKKLYKLQAEVLLYPGTTGWHFAYLPKGEAGLIRERFGALHRGWTSLPVEVKLGSLLWRTSMFYDRRNTTYILPLKAEVRKKAGVFHKDVINFSIRILV